MASRSQNRPPRSPTTKRDGVGGGIGLDKTRKLGVGRMGLTSTTRTRQALTVVNRQDVTVTSDIGSTEGTETAPIDFTKEEVEALLNGKPKAKKFDLKAKMEQMTDYNKRLKLCVKWFQREDEKHLLEEERLKTALAAAEKKATDYEDEMKKKEEEYNGTISELREDKVSLQVQLANEVTEKTDAIDNYQKEKEARVAAENLQKSLNEELNRAHYETAAANKKASSLDDMCERLQEYNTSLSQYNVKLQADLANECDSRKRVEMEKQTIVENLSILRGHYNSLQGELKQSRDSQDEAIKKRESLVDKVKCLRVELQQARDDRDHHAAQVKILIEEIDKSKEKTGKSLAELECLIQKTKFLEETCSEQRNQISHLGLQLNAAKKDLKIFDLSASETKVEFEEQRKTIRDLQERLVEAEHQITEGEKLRKKLHNTILELKGNIRVFCRVRPLLPDDGIAPETPVITYPTSTEALGRGIDLIQSGQQYPFTFDKVFSHETTQQDVFVEISQLVQSALDGYKVCIFAYGQTGSGKTYTMMGRPDAFDQKGMIPRSLEQIFQTSQTLIAQGWKYKMQASMLEIYNETIRDLLSTNQSKCDDNGVSGKQYTIKHDTNGNTHVSDLTIVDVCSITEVSSLLRQAAQSRSVGKTQMNDQSSRSHFVFTLRISGVNENTEQQVQGVLNLIDLAGSERLSKSGATGERLKETRAINKSLSCLSDVIFALAKKEDHVPFRNSKLTYLLQPCLGADSKTLMFVNVSPDPASVGESLCSLRFAARVNACEIGIPRRQTSVRSADSRLSYG
ncbi:hypothetical protein ACFE04_001822 [Oxalis oulophora]